MTAREEAEICFWREDIDSLAFQPAGHDGLCVLHRRAFRSLLECEPTSAACCAYFENMQSIFQHAARAKILRANIASVANFHLNSRDIQRALDQTPY